MGKVWNKGLHVYLKSGGVSLVTDNCTCLICSKPFHCKQSQIDAGKGKYCSKSCYGKARSGWMKEKSFNPVYRTDLSKEKNPNWRGGNCCVDCRKEIGRESTRCARCNYDFYSGSNHPLWIENKIHLYPAGWNRTFKEQIRFRDGYKCQLCGIPETETGKTLVVHHIDYDKNNLKRENLVSLCNSSHAKTNFKREYWMKYFSEAVMPNAPTR